MSIFDHPDLVPLVTTWRCPHCHTLQPESSRCRACGRSGCTCASCAHFRRSIVAGLGTCAADPHRGPLGGDEVEPCWQAERAAVPRDGLFAGAAPSPRPVGSLASGGAADAVGPAIPPAPSAPAPDGLVDAPPVIPRLGGEGLRRRRRREG